MSLEYAVLEGTLPTIEEAVQAFFVDFDFGERGDRTRLSYRSGARAFLRFVKEHEALDLSSPIADLSSSVTADFKAWLQSTEHTGPGQHSDEEGTARPRSTCTCRRSLASCASGGSGSGCLSRLRRKPELAKLSKSSAPATDVNERGRGVLRCRQTSVTGCSKQ